MDHRTCVSEVFTLNSEVGSETLGIVSFYLRAVCMNRDLWGVENFDRSPSGIRNLPRSGSPMKPHRR
jgi:hypothetical protein